MLLKERSSYNSQINKKINYSGIKKKSMLKDNLEFSHSKSKEKQYKINITLKNEKYKNNIIEIGNQLQENHNIINRINSSTSNKSSPSYNKIQSNICEIKRNQSNNIKKISFANPINFNSPKLTKNNANKIQLNNNSNNIEISVNFSNIPKKNISKDKIKQKKAI